MYNITELNEMPDADLKSVAEGMGIKKIDLSKREELVYRMNHLEQGRLEENG